LKTLWGRRKPGSRRGLQATSSLRPTMGADPPTSWLGTRGAHGLVAWLVVRKGSGHFALARDALDAAVN
jgi:hypothetical protein